MMSGTNKQSLVLLDNNHRSRFTTFNRIAVLVLLLGIIIATPKVFAEQKSLTLLNPPGNLIPIGTHRLHLYCKGSGSPTIMIDAGMGSFSMEWKEVHDSLASNVTTCLYDRAGYGWSDASPFPRTSKQISDELYFLIKAAGITDPLVLVGHSFGGYTMQYFASDHPDMVAGIVLVDSSHPDQFKRMDLRRPEKSISHYKKTLRRTISWPVLHQNYPAEVKTLAMHMLTRQNSHITRYNEQYHFQESANQVAKMNNRIPDVPLVVISRGKRVWPQGERGDKHESAWEEMQAELSYLTTISIQLIAKNSGHSIHLDQPKLVSSAILNTVGAARKIAAKKFNQFEQSPQIDNSMIATGPSQYKSALEYYFDYTMLGAFINHSDSTLYYDPSAYALNYH